MASGMAFDGTNIWVARSSTSTVSKINPATNTVVANVIVGPGGPQGLAFDGTNIWVTVPGFGSNVSKINPTTNTVIATVIVGNNPQGVAFDGTNIWVTDQSSDNVSKIVPF